MSNGSRYPLVLGAFNVVLLISSTLLLFLGASLLTFYHLQTLSFISTYFSAVPYFMVATGIGMFIITLYGLIVAGSGTSRCHLNLFGCLMILLFCITVVGVFAAFELRNVINRDEFSGVNVLKDLADYDSNRATKAKWDTMQRDFHCCGGLNFNDGYKVRNNF